MTQLQNYGNIRSVIAAPLKTIFKAAGNVPQIKAAINILAEVFGGANKIVDGLTSALNTVKGLIKGIPDLVESLIHNSFIRNLIGSDGVQAILAMAKVIRNKIDDLVGKTDEVVTAVKNIIRGSVHGLEQLILKIMEGTETVFEVVRETLELQDGSLLLKFLDGAETIITKAELQAAMIAKGMGDKLDEVWQLCKVGCFSGDTLVVTKEGPKRIDEIKEGELVYSKNVNTGDYDYKKVLQVYIKSSKEFIRLKFEDEDIRTTPTHPFFVEEGWWKTAQNIKQGDRIVTASGQLKEVLAIEIESLSEPERIYNLNVDDYHTYFVGASGLLVHNGCKRVDYTNPAGRALYWVNQNVKNVNIAIDSALNSTNAGKALEGKVADYIRNNIKEVTGFGQQVTRTVEKTFAGDLDIVTADAIIEVKKSIGAVSYDQIRKYADPSHADFLNNLNKKVILYIEEAVDMTNSNNVKMLNDIKAKGVSVVINSLEGLKEVLS